MSYRSSTIFELKASEGGEDILEKVASLSGHHLCYWELDPLKNLYKEYSSYLPIEGVSFSDFNWPKPYLSEESWAVYERALKELMVNQVAFDLKFEFQSLKKWVRIVTNYSKEKGIYQGTVKDITSEFMTDLTLRKRTIELSAFDEGLDSFSIVARTDPKGRIIYANKEFCRLSQYSFDELVGQDHRIVNSGHHSKDFFKDMWDSILAGQSWRGMIKNKAKDGSFYWVDTIVIPIRDEVGQLLEILSFRFDVTLMQTYREEINRLKSQVAELMSKRDYDQSV